MMGNKELGVKTFTNTCSILQVQDGAEELENVINEWLDQAENHVEQIYDIKYTNQIGGVNRRDVIFTAMVTYKKHILM